MSIEGDLRITLRRATDADRTLTYEITREAMRGYALQTWGCWDEEEQTRKHRDNYTPETHRLIVADDVVAGLVAIEGWPDDPHCLWLVKLYLLARFRGQGIGTQVLRGVLAEAAAAEPVTRPVRLRVLRVNTPAQALYRAHGFRVIKETPERLIMEWRQGG